MSKEFGLLVELLEETDSESKKGAKTFGELSPKLQKRFNDKLLPKFTSEEEVIDIRRRIMNSLTGSELMCYLDKRFHGIAIPEDFLAIKKKFIEILLKDL